MTKTSLNIIFVLVFCTACAGQQAYRTISSFTYGLVTGNPYQPISLDYYEDQKYSFAMAKVGRSDPVRLILEKKEGQLFKWVSADKTIIFTNRYGKIVKSKGLKNDIDLRLIPGQSLLSIKKVDEIFDNHIQFSAHFHEPELLNIRGYDSFDTRSSINFEHFNSNYKNVTKLEFKSNFPMIKWYPKGFIIISDNRVISSSQYIHPHHPKVDIYFYYK